MTGQLVTKFQEQFWILNRIANESPAYNIAEVFTMNTMPDIDKLEKAINLIAKKYDVLRSEYTLTGNQIMMHLVDENDLNFKVECVDYKFEPVEESLPSEIFQEIHTPFDLSKAPLFRVKIFQYSKTYFISFVFHHIIIDLHSKNIFFKELGSLYNESLINTDNQNATSVKQYKTYAEEHNTWLKSKDAQKMLQLWKQELPPINHLINLPTTQERQKSINHQGKRKYFSIDQETRLSIDRFTSEFAINNFTFCLSAYFILLYRLTSQAEIVIGVPLSNRREQSNSDVFGCFVNIVPIKITFDKDSSIENIIRQVRKQLLFAHRKQEIPFLSMIELENSNRNLAYNPYFQTGFTFEPLAKLNLEGVELQSIPVEKAGSQLDLFITMWESDDKFNGYVEYSTHLFSNDMADRIEQTYKKVIREILAKKVLVSEILILPAKDKDALQSLNNTNRILNTNKCLHQQFEEQVVTTPNEIALRYNGKSLTYTQLNQKANKLSNFLIRQGIQIEDIVGISIERSFELIIAIIAIHKAGAAYLPIDSEYPKERINNIVEDGKPKIILTTSKNANILSELNNLILLEDVFSGSNPDADTNPDVKVSSNNLAYLLFTSGSTGRPKGVMIEHHSVINKLLWMQHMHPIAKNESLLLKTPVTFDVSVWELFWWFFNGSCLTILPPNGEKDPNTIIETVANNNVNTLIFVPSMFAPFVDYIKSKNAVSSLSKLKYIILIGEALGPKLVMDFNLLRTDDFSPRLVNTYGPTEATVAVSYYDCPETNPVDKVFIGKPIFNTKLFVIDKYNQICPVGVPGELVIAGENLARGYKNSIELNSTRFIEIKDLEDQDIKVYRTGDIAKWDESGELDFIGRVDNQVKIRGYRIELGDIENKLLKYEAIETAVVVVRTINLENKHLVAYVVLKEGFDSNSGEIKDFLKLNLPEYMVPTYIMVLDKMPLNSSEKIDRKALPDPKPEGTKTTVTPGSNTEKILSKIWEDLLNIKGISITSNFFDIGGNSLLVISMVSRISDLLQIDIEPVIIMQFSTIRDLSSHLDNLQVSKEQDNSLQIIREKASLRNSVRTRPRNINNN